MTEDLINIFKNGWYSNKRPKNGVHHWRSLSFCGDGSEGVWAAWYSQQLELVVKHYDIKTVADIGCGDLNLGGTLLPFVDKYYGYDLIDWGEKWNIVRENWGHKVKLVSNFDITKDICEEVDLIVCNNVFIHYPNRDILKCLDNISKSNSKMFYAVEHNEHHDNNSRDESPPSIRGHGPINLSSEPFNLKRAVIPTNNPIFLSNNKIRLQDIKVWRLH
tara:strand:- start:2266 stop:2919 length:654 start_codon:yes stop_codon:yes gene_type:complete